MKIFYVKGLFLFFLFFVVKQTLAQYNYVATIGVTAVSGTTSDKLNSPNHLTVANGKIYIVDAYRVKIYGESDRSYVGAIGTLTPGTSNSQFNYPYAVAVSKGKIYVTDASNHRVQIFNESNLSYLGTLGQTAVGGSDNSHFQIPSGICITNNRIYISDTFNSRLQIYNEGDLSFVGSIGTLGVRGSSNTEFDILNGVSVSNGKIYVSDYNNHRVQVFAESDFRYLTTIGTTGVNGSSNNHFNYTADVKVAFGRIYVSDSENNRVQVFRESDLAYLATVGKTGLSGTTNDKFNVQFGIALSETATGMLYVADNANQRVQIFSFKLDAAINFPTDLGNKVYGTAPILLSATSSSGLPVIFSSDNESVATVTGNLLTVVGVGTANILAVQAETTKYLSAFSTKELLVAKSPQVVTLEPLADVVYGTPPTLLSARASTELPIQFTTSDPTVATVSGNMLTYLSAGLVTVTATQLGTERYLQASSSQEIRVSKASQVVTLDEISDVIFGAQSVALNARATTGLPIEFFSDDVSVATVNGNLLSFHHTGTATITARQIGNDQYLEATGSQTVRVNKATQRIEVEVPGAVTEGSHVIINAKASSGLPVTFTLTGNLHAVLAENELTLTSPGRVSVVANQSGNENYLAAEPREFSFCSLPTRPSLQLTQDEQGNVVLTSSYRTNNQWLKNAVLISGETNAKLTITESGSYAVVVEYEGCNSSSDAYLITSVEESSQRNKFSIFPNPVADLVVVEDAERIDQVLVMSVDGRIIHSDYFINNQSSREISLHALDPGVYLMQIKSGRRIKVQKFIKI